MSKKIEEADKQKISNKISETGFELEYKVTKKLEDKGWIVINSKYYVDDVSDKVREIDLVAYKAYKINGIYVYTTLLISCKKSNQKYWGFLCKDKNPEDPNINWQPVDNWTNAEELNFFFNKKDWKTEYLSANDELEKEIFNVDKHIFAFQELDKNDFAARNDTAIYNSVTSLIKAMGYELNNLPTRKRNLKCLYNFNLITVADTSLIEIFFDENNVQSQFVNNQKYVGSFIVNKNEIFSRIHFIEWSNFEKKLEAYNKLHVHNSEYVDKKVEEFYSDIFSDTKRVNVFKEKFVNSLKEKIHFAGNMIGSFHPPDIQFVTFNYSKSSKLKIGLFPGDESTINKMNHTNNLKESVTKLLKKYYRYSGDWEFVEGLPF